MSHTLKCWKCGASLAELSLPLRRIDECRACRAELHVCRMCEFYDTTVAKSCRETIAEEVKDKQRANFGLAPDQWKDGICNSPHGASIDKDGNLIVSEWSQFGHLHKFARVK